MVSATALRLIILSIARAEWRGLTRINGPSTVTPSIHEAKDALMGETLSQLSNLMLRPPVNVLLPDVGLK